MNRTVTQQETEELFKFCREHYVYHYDLQVELVDQLASSIEEQWETFRKFGIHGFSKTKSTLTNNFLNLLCNFKPCCLTNYKNKIFIRIKNKVSVLKSKYPLLQYET